MVEQQDFGFDVAGHRQPPPVVNFPGAQPPQPARPAPPQQPPPQQQARLFAEPIQNVTPQYVHMARAVSQILATRALLLIAVVAGTVIWAYTTYDPTQLRIVAGGVYSALVLWPLTWLYWKKG